MASDKGCKPRIRWAVQPGENMPKIRLHVRFFIGISGVFCCLSNHTAIIFCNSL